MGETDDRATSNPMLFHALPIASASIIGTRASMGSGVGMASISVQIVRYIPISVNTMGSRHWGRAPVIAPRTGPRIMVAMTVIVTSVPASPGVSP